MHNGSSSSSSNEKSSVVQVKLWKYKPQKHTFKLPKITTSSFLKQTLTGVYFTWISRAFFSFLPQKGQLLEQLWKCDQGISFCLPSFSHKVKRISLGYCSKLLFLMQKEEACLSLQEILQYTDDVQVTVTCTTHTWPHHADFILGNWQFRDRKH